MGKQIQNVDPDKQRKPDDGLTVPITGPFEHESFVFARADLVSKIFDHSYGHRIFSLEAVSVIDTE